MVTGDHPHTALAIARDVGLVASASPVVVQGAALRKATPAELQIALDAPVWWTASPKSMSPSRRVVFTRWPQGPTTTGWTESSTMRTTQATPATGTVTSRIGVPS